MEQNDRLYDIAVSDNNASYSRAMWILVGVMIVVLAVIFAVWFGIKASLVAPMNRLIDSIRHIAGGDLVKPIEVDGSNEMGQLAESLRHMQGELMRTVGDVRNGANAIYSGASEIATGNNDLFAHRATGRFAGRDGSQHGATDRNGETERRECARASHGVKCF